MTPVWSRLHAGLRGEWPVFMCGFRPFFVLAAVSAVGLMLAWLWIVQGQLLLSPPGGVVLWHGHELIFGFVTASIAGFSLTAIPEFTHTRSVSRSALVWLAGWWVLARLAYVLAGWWPSWLGVWPAALCNVVLWGMLLGQITPAVWHDPGRRHLSFAVVLATMAGLQLGFFIALACQVNALAWLYAAVGMVMVLIVVAASRVSMAVVNGRIEQGRPGRPEPGEASYLARPPRRNLAIFCISLCSVVEFILGHHVVTGWVALAAAAAMLNLLNDWHVGKPLFTRWALMLYTTYWLMALGYGLMGAAWLGAPVLVSAGRHLLMAGAMGLSIFTIMTIAGRIHAGVWLDYRLWLPCAAVMLVVASVLRAAAGIGPLLSWSWALWMVSGGVWAACFALYLLMSWRVLTGPRADGIVGCDEPLPASSTPDQAEPGR